MCGLWHQNHTPRHPSDLDHECHVALNLRTAQGTTRWSCLDQGSIFGVDTAPCRDLATWFGNEAQQYKTRVIWPEIADAWLHALWLRPAGGWVAGRLVLLSEGSERPLLIILLSMDELRSSFCSE